MPLGDAFLGLVALSALPLVTEWSRDTGANGTVGGAISSGSGGGLVLWSMGGGDVMAPFDGEGTAVETQCVVSASFLHCFASQMSGADPLPAERA